MNPLQQLTACLALCWATLPLLQAEPTAAAAAQPAHASHESAPPQAAVLDDRQAIEHAMKHLFDKPEAPLEVGPVSVEGHHAVAGWIQHGRGGRALLQKEGSTWTIQVCGGDGLKDATALAMTGMPAPAARRLAQRVTQAERQWPAERVKLFSLFKGTVRVDGTHSGDHTAPSTSHHPTNRKDSR
jgi:hypothetical protein